MSPKLNPVMHFTGLAAASLPYGVMDDHEIDQAIYALVAISAVVAAVWAGSVLVKLHADGLELLSWNSWLNFFSS
jgi:hypothetical protein